MLASPRSLSFDHDKPFRYVGGDPSIDLVNTAEWTNRGLEKDRLSGYDRLTQWAEGARVITPADAKRLRAVAAEHPRSSREAYEAARRLRALLQRVFAAVARGTSLGSELTQLNTVLADALMRAELTRVRSGMGGALGIHSLAGHVVGCRTAPVRRSVAPASVRRTRMRLDVHRPQPQRSAPLVSDGRVRHESEDAPAPRTRAPGRSLGVLHVSVHPA